MRIKQTSFTGGMTGRQGQYVRDIKNSFIEGVNLLPRRDGSLEARPNDKRLPLNFLPTDKYLNFRYQGNVYHVIYDTFFKQKLSMDTLSAADSFYNKYLAANPPKLNDGTEDYSVTLSSDLTATNHKVEVISSSIARSVLTHAETSRSNGESLYEFVARAFSSIVGQAVNFPLGCTFYEDIIKAGLGLRTPTTSELVASRGGAFAEKLRQQRNYWGFGLDRVFDTVSMGSSHSPPWRILNTSGGWNYNFLHNYFGTSVPSNYEQDVITLAENVSGDNIPDVGSLGDGWRVFRHDPSGTHNWYCRFLIFNEQRQLVSYEVQRPYFVEHDSGETTVALPNALTIPEGETPPPMPNVDELETYLRSVMDRNLESARLQQGVTDLVYEAEVFSEYVMFTNREGKLPPLVFTPPDPKFEEHPYGYVRDLRCLYGLSGYIQESYIKGNETGGTSVVNRDGGVVERGNRNVGTLRALAQSFLDENAALTTIANEPPNPTPSQRAEVAAANSRVIGAFRDSLMQEAPRSETFNRIAKTDTSLFSSPAVTFDKVLKNELPEDSPLRTFDPRVASSQEDSRELVTVVSKQLPVDEDAARGVTDRNSFINYLSSARFGHLSTIVQIRTGEEDTPHSYQMVDLVRRDGESFKKFVVEESARREYVRLNKMRPFGNTAIVDAVGFGVAFTDYINRGQSDKDFAVIPHGLDANKVPGTITYPNIPRAASPLPEISYDVSGGGSSDDFLIDDTFFKFDIGNLEQSTVSNLSEIPGSTPGGNIPNTIGQPNPQALHTLETRKLALIDYAIGSNEGMYFNIASNAASRLALVETFIRRGTVTYSQSFGRLLFDNLIDAIPPGLSIDLLGFFSSFTPQGGAEVRWMSFSRGVVTIGLRQGVLRYQGAVVRGILPTFFDESTSGVSAPIRSHDASYQIGNSLRHVYLIEDSRELQRKEYEAVTKPIFTDYLKNDPIRKLISIPNEGYLILITEGGLCFFGLVIANGMVGWSRLSFSIEGEDERVLDAFTEESVAYFVFSVTQDGVNSNQIRSVEFDKFEELQEGEEEITSTLELLSPYRYAMEVEETDPTQNTDSFSVRGGKMTGSFSNEVKIGTSGKGTEYIPSRLRDGIPKSIIDIGSVSLNEKPHLSGMKFIFKGRTTITSLFYKVD